LKNDPFYGKILKMKRILVLISLLFLFSVSFSETATTEQQKLKEIQDQLEAQKRKLVETKKKEQESLSKLVEIKGELKKTTRDLNRAKTKITENVTQINELSSDINEARETLGQKSEKLKKRVREVYKSSTVNYLDLLFSTKSMSDFINRAYFFGKIIDGDAKLINELSTDYKLFREKKEKLVTVTEDIKGLAQEIGEKRQEIASKANEEKEVLSDLKDRREDYEKKIAELEKSSEEMEQVIQSKMAQRKKAGIYAKGTGSLDWPLRGRITSRFGVRRHPYWGGRHTHTGLDIAAPYGEVIRAADGGEVIFSGWWDGYGKAVVIDHGKSISTVYAHMSRIYAQNGSKISKGQIIGLIGSTGYSTGPHCHFEVRVNGKPKNPMSFLP
jgi:murein DD-endopeptidase MepM/ murein hydrolase activator NlpD